MGTQLGYGVSDTVGAPFQLLATATGVVTGNTVQMVGGGLHFNGAATIAAQTVTLPQNPVDGCVAEISSSQVITALTVQAATNYAPQGTAVNQAGTVSDVIVNGVLGAATTITPTAQAGGVAIAVIKYKYSLNGYTNPTTGVVSNARTWFRVQ